MTNNIEGYFSNAAADELLSNDNISSTGHFLPPHGVSWQCLAQSFQETEISSCLSSFSLPSSLPSPSLFSSPPYFPSASMLWLIPLMFKIYSSSDHVNIWEVNSKSETLQICFWSYLSWHPSCLEVEICGKEPSVFQLLNCFHLFVCFNSLRKCW